jgi:LPXTG-motif cell wall-anchored protein
VRRTAESLGTVLMAGGGVVAAAGFALIYVRSRRKDD